MINVKEIDTPESYKDFVELMSKFKKESSRLLINVDEEWRTAYVKEAHFHSVTIQMIGVGNWSIYINTRDYEDRYRNELNNSLYVIEDLFYKLANA